MKKERIGSLDFDRSHVVSYDDVSAVFANNGIRFRQDAPEEPERPLYRFAAFSDIHLETPPDGDPGTGNGRGVADFAEALSACAAQGVSFFCVAGDVGMNYGSLSASTADSYRRAFAMAGVDPARTPAYVCKGNHDVDLYGDEWRAITSCDSSFYAVEKGGDLFAFLSNNRYDGKPNHKSANVQEPYDEEDLDRLEETLAGDPARRVFLFMHFPLNSGTPRLQYAGLEDDGIHPQGNSQHLSLNGLSAGNAPDKYHSGGYGHTNSVTRYGFAPTFREDGSYDPGSFNRQSRRIADMLRNRPGTSVVFSGHTHLTFDADVYCPRVNFCRSGNMCTVHVPSLNYPRSPDWKTVCDAEDMLEYQPQQGYIVEVYADRAVIKGFDFNPRLMGFDYSRPLRQYVAD